MYSCHEKTSHHNKTNMSLKSCTCVCTCLWWTHNFYGALHIIIDILKYISITTCTGKQHNGPVGSLGFWVDQFLWDSWVPLTHEFTSSTNSSFFYSCKFMILPPHEKQWFLGILYLITFLILNISKDSGFYQNNKLRDTFLS